MKRFILLLAASVLCSASAFGVALSFSTQPDGSTSGVVLTQPPVVTGAGLGTGLVTLVITSGNGTISAGASVAAVAGTATFTALNITGLGAHTLQASAAGFTSVTSSVFAVIGALSAQIPVSDANDVYLGLGANGSNVYAMHNHVDDPTRVFYRRSTTEGATFPATDTAIVGTNTSIFLDQPVSADGQYVGLFVVKKSGTTIRDWIYPQTLRDRDSGEVGLRRSVNTGGSFADRVLLSDPGAPGYRIGSAIKSPYWHVAWMQWRATPAGGGDPVYGQWDIFYNRSINNGAAFATPTPIVTSADAAGVGAERPVLAVDGNNVNMVWMDGRDGRGPCPLEGGVIQVLNCTEIYFKRSTDYGANWGPDKRLTNSGRWPDQTNLRYAGRPFIAARSGTIIVPYDLRQSNAGNDIAFTRSTDYGDTWNPPAPTPTPGASPVTVDPAFIVNSAGESTHASVEFGTIASEVAVVWWEFRATPTPSLAYEKFSIDGGATWSKERALSLAGTNGPADIAVSSGFMHFTYHAPSNGVSQYRQHPISTTASMATPTPTPTLTPTPTPTLTPTPTPTPGMTPTPTPSGTPDAPIIPLTRRITWHGNVGVPGGIPASRSLFKNVLTTTDPRYKCFGDGNTNDAQALTNALNDCPPGSYVYAPAATYRIQAFSAAAAVQVYGPSHQNWTLKGDGMGRTIFKMTGSTGRFYIGYEQNPDPGLSTANGLTITAGATAGSTVLTVGDTTNVHVGNFVTVQMDTPAWMHKIVDPARPEGADAYNFYFKFTYKVLSKTNTTVTLCHPIPMDVTPYNPRIIPWGNAGLSFVTNGVGLEDFTIDATNGSEATLTLNATWGCWTKSIEMFGSNRKGIVYNTFLAGEVRHCYTHDFVGFNTNHEGIDIVNNGCWNLIEDNITVDAGTPQIVLGDAVGACVGNVVGYNFQYQGTQGGLGTTYQQSASNNHGMADVFNLWEGNVMNGWNGSDHYFGTASYTTLFRNWVHNTSGDDKPTCVNLGSGSVYFNIVGNIVGSPLFLGSRYDTEVYCTEERLIYRLGYPNTGGNCWGPGPEGVADPEYGNRHTIRPTNPPDYHLSPNRRQLANALDLNVKNTIIRHGNFDYATLNSDNSPRASPTPGVLGTQVWEPDDARGTGVGYSNHTLSGDGAGSYYTTQAEMVQRGVVFGTAVTFPAGEIASLPGIIAPGLFNPASWRYEHNFTDPPGGTPTPTATATATASASPTATATPTASPTATATATATVAPTPTPTPTPSPTPTSWASDPFEDGSAVNITSRAMVTGQNWAAASTWSGTFNTTIAGNAYSTALNKMDLVSTDVPSANYTVAANISYATIVNDMDIGVVGRSDSAGANCYRATFLPSSAGQVLYLKKEVAASFIIIGTYSLSGTDLLTAGSVGTLELVMNGSSVKVFWKHTQRIAVTDTTITAAGRAGIWADTATSSTGPQFKDFNATLAASYPTPTPTPTATITPGVTPTPTATATPRAPFILFRG